VDPERAVRPAPPGIALTWFPLQQATLAIEFADGINVGNEVVPAADGTTEFDLQKIPISPTKMSNEGKGFDSPEGADQRGPGPASDERGSQATEAVKPCRLVEWLESQEIMA
jgi:hypothetical protein